MFLITRFWKGSKLICHRQIWGHLRFGWLWEALGYSSVICLLSRASRSHTKTRVVCLHSCLLALPLRNAGEVWVRNQTLNKSFIVFRAFTLLFYLPNDTFPYSEDNVNLERIIMFSNHIFLNGWKGNFHVVPQTSSDCVPDLFLNKKRL